MIKGTRISVPLWRPLALCGLMALLGFLLGFAILVAGPHALSAPAYKPMRVMSYSGWAALYLVPSTAAATLLGLGTRRNAFFPLIALTALEVFWTAILLIYAVGRPSALTGVFLFGIFSACTLLAAITSADL